VIKSIKLTAYNNLISQQNCPGYKIAFVFLCENPE
jgi:hypothetical protein